MKNYMRSLVFVLALVFSYSGFAQNISMGIRAGLNYSQFSGPSEEGVNESFGVNSGFHFGVNVGYEINDFLSIRGEVAYTQYGTQYNYDDISYYTFLVDSGNNVYVTKIDSAMMDLDISNAYISIPITFNVKTLEKWEFFGGAYINFLISPIGQGTLRFGSRENPEHSFIQGLNYNYGDDVAGSGALLSIGTIGVLIDGNEVRIERFAGAYYQFPQEFDASGTPELTEVDNFINAIDYGLTFGVGYYLNRGLCLSLKGNYGLRDITNAVSDRSLRRLDEEGNLIFNDDFDRQLGLEVSLGFRF